MQSNFCVPGFSEADFKSTVVSTFFLQWAKVVLPHAWKAGDKIGFLDFFSGPGKNNDGNETAPVLVLKHAAACCELSNLLVAIYNDREPKNIVKLRQIVACIEGLEQLKYEPRIEKGVSFEDLMSSLQAVRILPTLLLIDPLHIKDFAFDSFSSHLKNLNFDCIIQVNYSQLEKIIENPFKEKYMETLFGKQVAGLLMSIGDRLNPLQKESLIMKTLVGSLKNIKGYHSVLLKYRLKDEQDINYQVFITKYSTRYRLYTELLRKTGYQELILQNQKMSPAARAKHSLQAGLFVENNNE